MDHGINHATQDVVAEVMRADRRPRRRPRLRARRRRALPEGPRLARRRTGASSSAAATRARSSPSTSSRSSAMQQQVIGSFVYTRSEVETCLELARAGARSSRSSTRRSRSTRRARRWRRWSAASTSGRSCSSREARAMKRLGVDVGGTFTDLIYVDDEAGADPRPQARRRRPDDPSQGTVQGIQELAAHAGDEPVRARPGLPRDDDRDEHRDRAQRRAGRDDHDRGLPRHPPHRAAQEAAQLLELPGSAVAARTRSCAAATG